MMKSVVEPFSPRLKLNLDLSARVLRVELVVDT